MLGRRREKEDDYEVVVEAPEAKIITLLIVDQVGTREDVLPFDLIKVPRCSRFAVSVRVMASYEMTHLSHRIAPGSAASWRGVEQGCHTPPWREVGGRKPLLPSRLPASWPRY